jgi:hypothetical protein
MTILRNNAIRHCVGVARSVCWPGENNGGSSDLDSRDRERLTFGSGDAEIYEIWKQLFFEDKCDL